MKTLMIVAIGASLLVSFVAGFLVRKLAPDFGFVDKPGGRKQHKAPTPTAGGVAIWLGVVAPIFAGQIVIWLVQSVAISLDSLPWLARMHWNGILAQLPKLWIILAGGTAMMTLGLVDDRVGLDWRTRIAIETIIAGAMVAFGFKLTFFVDIPWLTAIITIFWIVGLVNSFNMLDNMDGLSAGVAAIAAGVLATMMLTAPHQPQLFVAGLLLLLAGSLVGFLGHNHAPARLFMGDGGSYFIGFMIAMATILATYAGGNIPKHAILAPLCALAIPFYDTASVVWIRLRRGISPFKADTNHFSHRLVGLGLSRKHAVWTIYLAAATCGLGALLLPRVSVKGALVVVSMVGCVLLIIAIMEATGRRRIAELSRRDEE